MARLGAADPASVESGHGSASDEVAIGADRLLVALTELRRLRARLARWEPTLIAAARDRGVTWTDLAPVLGVSSRQAAESRYLRMKRDTPEARTTTRDQRMRATRHQRSGDRAVAGWARDNAAELRSIAGQIAALPNAEATGSGDGARERAALVSRVTDALGNNDAAALVAPLLDAGSALRATHPALAGQVSALAASAEQIRAADLDRRTTGSASTPASPDRG
ncbi:hypothetical protein ACIA58_23370 [Kribbella sp. NPDC051586]|uniref:hypothetical protein n=1 Tax=Kribbella sp. NPDC051586 TaxID=3364118 RepID=UPI0037B6B4D3